MVKNPPASAGDTGSILGQDDSLEKEMATHSSVLAWKFHKQRKLVGYNPWAYKRVKHIWACVCMHAH